MKKVERNELLGLGDYEGIRERFRTRIIEAKRARRVTLGDELSLVFENRDTLLWQIQEMLRTERITNEKAIAHELETYNELMPGDSELSATLFIEILERERREEMLTRLCAIEEHVAFEIDGEQCRATFEEGRRDRGRAAAVQYLKFPLTPKARDALRARRGTAHLVFDHPAFSARIALGPKTLDSLSEDVA
jgi:hypothetical protein